MSVLSMNVLTYGKKRRLLHEPRIEVFDIPSRQSKIIGNMPTARRFGSAQYHENKIFFMGGSRKSSITSTVDIYDVAKAAKVAKDEWKFVSQMPRSKVLRRSIKGSKGSICTPSEATMVSHP